MERIFQITAVILIGVAAFFLWKGNNDWMFVSAVVGAVCFFLSVRFQVKERMQQREKEIREFETTDEHR
jgi:type IV secretory pathway VirB2 component (pilin)